MRKGISLLLLFAAAAGAQTAYRDSDGRFTVQVPAGWQGSKTPDRVSTVTIAQGDAFVNLSVETSNLSAGDSLKNYERLIAQNCPGYHELSRDMSTLGGAPGVALRFTCSDPRRGNVAMSVAMASAYGQLFFFYASTPANRYDALKRDIEAMRTSFQPAAANSTADSQKLAALQKACAAGVFTADECTAKRRAIEGGNTAAPPNSAAVYRDPRGRFSATTPPGWTASPMGDGGADGVQIAHGASYAVISPFTGNVSAPGDVVNQLANQIQSQYKNLHLAAHNVFKLGVHDAAYAMFTGINGKGVEVSVTISGIAAGGGHYLAVISSVAMQEAEAVSPVLQQISQSIRFAGE